MVEENIKELEKKKKKQKKIAITVLSAILAAVIIGCGIFIAVDLNVAPRISINGTTLVIKDSYPKKIELAGSKVTLGEGKLDLEKRLAGTNAKNIRKGRFTLVGGEEVYLSICNYGAKYILIESGGNKYFINRPTDDETEALYRNIIEISNP